MYTEEQETKHNDYLPAIEKRIVPPHVIDRWAFPIHACNIYD